VLAVAAPDGHEEPDDEQQPEEVDDDLVDDVEGAVVEADAEVGAGDVGFEQHDQRADEEDEKAPEHEQVHDPGVDIAGADQALMQERHGQRCAQPGAHLADRGG
jgi:hypothetical protein